ncbi:hypothetical protein A3742_15110 [Oleiphilus sp. HI0071]|uniref:DEAD/DEAH box helicase n=1 Tax=Oleiphilus sp. HI0080 TaxID=1822255 RepID=UPI0007C2CD6A|nr:DEAD/DEAH box helicase [Oleiphilus sp. HI0080]KZY60152.1 hypothetical protein A3737_06975 [Oleiphilus sp. HI0065]KZY78473.1 hypothetical protein A3742_15110 [Oleiphilus sp. HI0071]KZZ18734.1 hypothetical protein A3751_01015 [Oleiphilus sp. HI0080]KZZ50336.1 hypothetical protein A3760_02260 [Oleiphilus sp. HI0122]
MANADYYRPLISHIETRSVESTVSILGITDSKLRAHLVKELSNKEKGTAFLGDSVFEATFPWEPASQKMSELSGDDGLLASSLIKAMDEADDHKFGKDWNPFKHQLLAWKALLEEQKSVVVTSGTGSGKTECFMVPVLNDLAREYEESGASLEGVRALFLYPLNALINSQRERLRAWTSAYNGGVKFCLYNGNTEENKHKEQGKYPNEVLTRKQLRESPSPILVTNATMLEYMLVRQNDAPIITKSKGKLRWIILDEAHTYIGSQAAELSLLLRRVMHSFGVEPNDIRFVATSATMGTKEAEKQLQLYLADLAGIREDQILVVGGKRSIPDLPKLPTSDVLLEEIKAIDSGVAVSKKRYDALSAHPKSLAIRRALTDAKNLTPTLSSLSHGLFGDEKHQSATLAWLDLCSFTTAPGPNLKKPELGSTPFLPLRGHVFHQVMSGLWCCSDKDCRGKQGTDLEEGWPFGLVHVARKQNCECGAPVFELVFCRDCNQPHLMAGEDDQGNLFQHDRESVDEFSLDIDEGSGDDGGEDGLGEEDEPVIGKLRKIYFAPRSHNDLTFLTALDRSDFKRTSAGPDTIVLNEIAQDGICACCEYEYSPSPFRHSYLGTPFYVGNAVPALLEACQEGEHPNDQPFRGRRLIAFTDSRQGTARISVKIQQDSERDSVRSMVYRAVVQNRGNAGVAERAEIEERIANYKKVLEPVLGTPAESGMKPLLELLEKDMAALAALEQRKPVLWNDLVEKLHGSPDIERWALDYYRNLNRALFPDTGGGRTLTELLLLREYGRRPKRANSTETLGLVCLVYPSLQAVKDVPNEWAALNLELDDWRSFLKLALDFYVRENTIMQFPSDWTNWIGAKIYPKSLLKFDSSEKTTARLKKWPQVYGKRNNRLVRMIEAASGVNVEDSVTKDRVNRVLQAAWTVLTSECKILKPAVGTSSFQLDRAEVAFGTLDKGWICPVTHRILDVTLKGVTPYLPYNFRETEFISRPVEIDIYEVDESKFSSREERLAHTREWLASSARVSALRKENLWTDVSDKVVEGAAFYRAVEHSAQLPASTLQSYEAKFKAGKVNVLSCSTTMEMGVDIGGISVVAMNNVPPHPANYLQRAGRAGRRGETQALAFTICKDNPHERSVFKDTQWPFKTKIPAPYIALNSQSIVQRHINSLLMAYFLNVVAKPEGEKSAVTLNCGWFYVEGDNRSSKYEDFRLWLETLETQGTPDELEVGLCSIKRGSVLGGYGITVLIANALDAIDKVSKGWLSGHRKLKIELDGLSKISDLDPYKRKVSHDLRQMEDEYLLKELASNAFLPGYGFPTGVVGFDHYSIHDFKSGKYLKKTGRIDNLARMRDRPSRDLPIAIREYAPGSDVVIDGKSYRSSGILLDHHAPDSGYAQPQKLMIEWRCNGCGQIDRTYGPNFDEHCTQCGARVKAENQREFIEPKGFAVDFYSEPSTDVTHQSFIPVKEPWVTAGGELHTLYEPKLGSYKVSSEGHIFHHSGGENDNGYAVCLRCGRAESMTVDGDLPHVFSSAHRRLQGKAGPEDGAMCMGSDESFAIKTNLFLGAADQTDVFELFLKHPKENRYLSQRDGKELLWTLAVVFRQSLADIHGITADELGYTVRPDNSNLFEGAVDALVLFDRCGGGAGFSSAAPFHMKDLFIRARQYLECKDQCDSACQSCLLGYDTRFHDALLNRMIAKEYMDLVWPYLEMPEAAKLLGEETQFCIGNLDSEVLRLAPNYDSIRLFISSFDNTCSVSGSNLKERCFKYLDLFSKVELVFELEHLAGLSESQREDLWALSRFGVAISTADEKVSPNILGQMCASHSCRTFATDNIDATKANGRYLMLDGCYCVFSDYKKPIATALYEKLKPEVKAGDVEVSFSGDCDGRISEFGSKFWGRLVESHEELNSKIAAKGELKSVSYVDSYVASPLNLLLFIEAVDGLKSLFGADWTNPPLSLRTGLKESPSRRYNFYGEWSDSNVQKQVFEEAFEFMGENLSVQLSSIRELPHDRTISLVWDDGSVTKVRLDHGFGPWSMQGERPTFNFESSAASQVKQLFEVQRRLKVEQRSAYPTLVFVKHLDQAV